MNDQKNTILAIVLSAFVLIGYWSAIAENPLPTSGDRTAFDVAADINGPVLTGLAKAVTHLGSGAITFPLAALAAAILALRKRWAEAAAAGRFDDELVAVGDLVRDEHPRPDTSAEKLASLKPAFRQGGTVTAGNSSGLNDGAAALVIASEAKAQALGIKPLGSFVASAVAGVDPRVMGIGPVPAVRKLLGRANVPLEAIDLLELNEAFASQSLAVLRELGLDEHKVNVNGGAIALGHPLGMSGARLVVTLLHELRRRDARTGIATMCVGVGQGQAALFSR